MEEDKIKLDVNFTDNSSKPKERGIVFKIFLGFIKDLGPLILGAAAIFYAYQQTKDTNETNYNAKIFEITYTERKQAYLDFLLAKKDITNNFGLHESVGRDPKYKSYYDSLKELSDKAYIQFDNIISYVVIHLNDEQTNEFVATADTFSTDCYTINSVHTEYFFGGGLRTPFPYQNRESLSETDKKTYDNWYIAYERQRRLIMYFNKTLKNHLFNNFINK
jgi:hypothetical protein